MNKDQVEVAVALALRRLLKNDAFLLEHGANERSLTHKLAEYLQQLLVSYNVDCEYGRHGIDVKRLPRRCRGRGRDRVYPDVVVHLRGTDEGNLLVIEAKPTWNAEVGVPECDKIKLQEFTKPTGDFQYRLGLFIGFNRLSDPVLVWFQEGVESNEATPTGDHE